MCFLRKNRILWLVLGLGFWISSDFVPHNYCLLTSPAQAEETAEETNTNNSEYLVLRGNEQCRKNKKVVLLSGDEEYRSEEELTQLARILSERLGFDTIVLFAIDPATGFVAPDRHDNIPGMEHLRDADLVIMAIKVKALPEDQLKEFLAYLRSGRPILALRTSTHPFRYPEESPYSWLSFRYSGPKQEWSGGFGRAILGETWVAHHAHQRVNATRAIPVPGQEEHPVLRAFSDIAVPTDLYEVRLPMQEGCVPLCYGLALETMSEDSPPLTGEVNDPMMPVVWTKPYSFDGGPTGMTLTTTMGSAEDLLCDGFRRLLVNAVFWLLDMDVPTVMNTDLVGNYVPSPYAFGGFRRNMKPADFLIDSEQK